MLLDWLEGVSIGRFEKWPYWVVASRVPRSHVNLGLLGLMATRSIPEFGLDRARESMQPILRKWRTFADQQRASFEFQPIGKPVRRESQF